MCPDRQLFSVYIDGELPSPWKEKLEAHIAKCECCQNKIKEFKYVTTFLHKENVKDISITEAQNRVWKTITPVLQRRKTSTKHTSIWLKPIKIPLSAAVAAVIVVAFFAALLGGAIYSSSTNSRITAQLNSEVNAIIPTSDINKVIEYLDKETESADIVIIKLPDNTNFVPSGQPTLIRMSQSGGR